MTRQIWSVCWNRVVDERFAILDPLIYFPPLIKIQQPGKTSSIAESLPAE